MDEAFIKKIQPHSLEAEQSVVGSMLMDNEAIVVAADMLQKNDFYQSQYAVLFETIIEIYNEGKNIDPILLQYKLKEKNVPENIGSIDYIKELIQVVPTSAHIKQYAEIVKEKAILRQLIKVTEGIASQCYLGKEDSSAIFETVEKEIFQLLQQRNTGREFVPIKNIVLEVLDTVEAASKNKGRVTGIPTGFYDLDQKLTGMHASELILIAARPAMGKSAFMLNIAQNVAFKEKITTAIFSLEMSKEQLVTRLMAMESMVDSYAIRTGDLQDNEWEKLMEGAAIIGNSNLIIDDTPGITISELRSKCRKFKQTYNLGLVIIDYLQLMSGGKKSESRQQEISEISRSLKVLAREINAPVIALSQLSRAVDSRTDHKPVLSDLRESGAIEQDADVVMFIYRDDYYNPDTDKKNLAEIIVAKQRSGSTGSVELVWLGQYTKFESKA